MLINYINLKKDFLINNIYINIFFIIKLLLYIIFISIFYKNLLILHFYI